MTVRGVFVGPYRRLCEAAVTGSVLDALWQAGYRGRTDEQLGDLASGCESLAKHGLIDASYRYWEMTESGQRVWRAWNTEIGRDIGRFGSRSRDPLPPAVPVDRRVAGSRVPLAEERARETASRPSRTPARFSPDDAVERVSEDGALLTMLYRIGDETARGTLRDQFNYAPPRASSRLAVALLKLEVLGLVDASFRLTERGADLIALHGTA